MVQLSDCQSDDVFFCVYLVVNCNVAIVTLLTTFCQCPSLFKVSFLATFVQQNQSKIFVVFLDVGDYRSTT